ncbi:bifunctional metallophosphatase/5'-nucleotidase [Lachnospiraceae bacterium MD335]|jgi:5'-nucleotidase|nr:bifunctional metallophosphatase/5'-nucleotidase [Lachnospiraceae bacterium MD335]
MHTAYCFIKTKEEATKNERRIFMNRFLKRILAGALSLAMAAGLAAMPANTAEAKEDLAGKLVVIHTNDIHGRYENNEESLGMSSVAALKGYYETQGANVLLFDAGDFSQGTNLVNYYDGLDSVHFLNAAGYDAVSLGNHEFDFGFDELKAMADAAQFPILDANILSRETNEPYFASNTVFTFGNMTVGVFGLDTPEAKTKASPKNVKDVIILDNEELFACAQAQVNELKAKGCDYIICIGHLGVDEESTGRRSVDVAANVNGIDLLVDGHSHTKIDGGIDVNGTKIVSTGSYLEKIGVVVYDGKTTKAQLVDDLYTVGGCPSMDAFVKSFNDIVKEAYAGTFATTTSLLDGTRGNVRTRETNLGDFSADAYKYTAETYVADNELDMVIDGAIQNGGGIRDTIAAGEISMDTLYKVFPFGNTVSIVTLKGSELLEALEASCFACPNELGGFPQVSGIQFTIDTSVPYAQGALYPDSTYYAPAAPGSRVTITSVGGKAFDPNATYNIAVNNFMADGGDTYYVFTNASQVIDTEVVDAEGLISYVNSLGGVIGEAYAAPKGNITIK